MDIGAMMGDVEEKWRERPARRDVAVLDEGTAALRRTEKACMSVEPVNGYGSELSKSAAGGGGGRGPYISTTSRPVECRDETAPCTYEYRT